ncbi:hypothetical protein [Metapseudomonas furukawaii]|uniref:hypothetical protein n=1 Tax=Metapseudomonas furukawaii TaxID=1149133 RepID=UPI001038E91F|nr:hypothetical protein [Pseudomonas furukawaii]
MQIEKRPYVPRTNSGGNFCGHNPDAPRLQLAKPTTLKNRPRILQRLQEAVRQYYRSPSRLPSLNAANRSQRQQRSERREACILALTSILEFTDLTSLRCGIPTAAGFQSLTLEYLAAFTGMGLRRMERAVADLKRSNILTVAQPRQLQEDGTYRGLAAVKAVNNLLFGAFGLLKWLKHERQRASERLAKRAKKQGGNLGQWSRSALAIGRMLVIGRGSGAGLPRIGAPPKQNALPIDSESYGRMFTDLVLALKQEDPGRDSATCRQIAEAILSKKIAG